MIRPIHVYGDGVLREEAQPIESDSPKLQELIDDMLDTMRGAEGIGLAAPQIGESIRLFVVDVSPMIDEEDPDTLSWPEMPMVLINPEILAESTDDIEYEEGCLSIPDIREYVARPEGIEVTFLDRAFEQQTLEIYGLLARVVQHELDHLDGVLFIDYLSAFKRRLLQRRLKDMSRGIVEADYPLAI